MKTAIGTAACVLVLTKPAWCAEFHVAPEGDDDATGSEQAPFASLSRAQEAAAPGDTVWVRGGTYAFSSGTVGVRFNKPGQPDNPIRYFAVPGEVPVFDLSAINPSGRVTGFDVNTNHLHIRGMEITGVPQFMGGQDSWGLRIQGSNNIIEGMNVHHNQAPGIFITSGSDNLILNCDSHHNYDVLENGGSGDGFGCHSTGGNNVIRGCRGWENSDDGYDFINAPGVCRVENSWSWRNGWVPDTNMAAGNGAGFKAGGFGLEPNSFPQTIPVHVVAQCVAWNNRAQGFYANHHPGRIDWLNNTAYDNPRNYDMLDDVGQGTHYLRNNLAFGNGGDLERSTADDSQHNSWDGGLSLSADDFQSLSDEGADGPRAEDGSLPVIPFLRLAAGSDLIDAGEDVGLPFNDAAPDLGAFETGEVVTTSTSSGGTAATGQTSSNQTSSVSATNSAVSSGGASMTANTGGAQIGSMTSAVSSDGTSAGGTQAQMATTSMGMTSTLGVGGASSTSTTGTSQAEPQGGCHCSLPGSRKSGNALFWLGFGLLGLGRRRRAQ